MNHEGRHGSVRNVRVWDASGHSAEPAFSKPLDVAWLDGQFTESRPLSAAPSDERDQAIDGSGLWLIPGLVDVHVHAAWHAFNETDREALSPERTRELTMQGLARNLAAGFTSVRDAGGLTVDAAQGGEGNAAQRPRVQHAIAMIDRAAADAAGGLSHAVAGVLEDGAQWVKLVGTVGVASPAGAGLEPLFSAAELRWATQLAASAGAGIMLHAWGGAAIDYAIEAAEASAQAPLSIEHGIFLTREQAERAAAVGATFVPTLRIYRLVEAMITSGELPARFGPRVAEAVQAHPGAVRIARDAGLAIALGTDSGTPEQHGTGGLELDALVAAGLTRTEALTAATRAGAALCAGVDPDQNRATAGLIAPGAPADAVLLTRDPREPGALSDPGAISAVILAGRVVAPASPERNPS
ncbi:amidohydrolase family protein [Leucobacter sp. HY1908]